MCVWSLRALLRAVASFTVPKAGQYLVHCTLDNAHVSGSPVVMRVSPSAACAAKCEARGHALEMSTAGKHESVSVWLQDGFGNARTHARAPTLD